MIDQRSGQSHVAPRPHAFNPNDHIIQIRSRDGLRDYLPVQWRLAWFREQCPHGTIETEMLHLDLDRDTEEEVDNWNSEKDQAEKTTKQGKGFVVFRAVVKDGKGGVGTGTKSEKAASFLDFIEKAETGAIGRALAALGFGTQFAPELSEEHRIVDSPVSRDGTSFQRSQVTNNAGKMSGNGHNAAPVQDDTAPATEQQVSSIRKLCDYLGKAGPEHMDSLSYLDAKKLIQQLTVEYRQSKKAS